VVFENLRCQAVHGSANCGQQHQDMGTLIAVGDGPLDRFHTPGQSFDSRKKLLLFLEIPGTLSSISSIFICQDVETVTTGRDLPTVNQLTNL
jgi:hypothetical protein